MNRLRCLLASLGLVFAAPTPAQDQATTLLGLLRAADAVVAAEVTAATDPSPDWHRLVFQTLTTVRGPAPESFVILEPAGACCGRSLFALHVGDRRLLFLRRQGATWHLQGAARGVLPFTTEVVAHVQALRDATDERALTHLLTQSLAHAEPRIADDAAHALAARPRLVLAPGDREAVVTAMQQALLLGSTNLCALVDVAARAADPATTDALLLAYLDAERDDQAAVLRSAICRHDLATADRLPTQLDGSRRAVRATELLVAMPGDAARTALTNLLQRATHPRVQLGIAEALLAGGARGSELASLVPAPVLQLAEARSRRAKPFRAIAPDRR